MTRNIRHTKTLNYFFDHLHWKHVPLTISFYMSNEADKLRHSVLHKGSTSEIKIWDVSKNFQVPPFQQCKGMPQLFCNLHGQSFTFLTLHWFHLSLYPTQLPVVVDKYGSIVPLLKICSLCYSHLRHRNHLAIECARAVYCFRGKKPQTTTFKKQQPQNKI